jgi:hypothetical protein
MGDCLFPSMPAPLQQLAFPFRFSAAPSKVLPLFTSGPFMLPLSFAALRPYAVRLLLPVFPFLLSLSSIVLPPISSVPRALPLPAQQLSASPQLPFQLSVVLPRLFSHFLFFQPQLVPQLPCATFLLVSSSFRFLPIFFVPRQLWQLVLLFLFPV